MALYLIHTTKSNPKYWGKLKTSPVNLDQFPGVYFSLVTKDNLNSIELFEEDGYIMIFSKKLLKQKNYHVNLQDFNGFVTEHNTLYPWNLKANLHRLTNSNEIVFHDPISMKYCCAIIKRKYSALPKFAMENKEKPNTELLPFYAYPFEFLYSGKEVNFAPSSLSWYKSMANMCSIKANNLTEIQKEFEKVFEYFHMFRKEQKINILREYKPSNIFSNCLGKEFIIPLEKIDNKFELQTLEYIRDYACQEPQLMTKEDFENSKLEDNDLLQLVKNIMLVAYGKINIVFIKSFNVLHQKLVTLLLMIFNQLLVTEKNNVKQILFNITNRNSVKAKNIALSFDVNSVSNKDKLFMIKQHIIGYPLWQAVYNLCVEVSINTAENLLCHSEQECFKIAKDVFEELKQSPETIAKYMQLYDLVSHI